MLKRLAIATMNVGTRKPRFSNAQIEEFYKPTFGTWIYNRDAQYAQRYLKFNVQALIDETLKVTGASRCLEFRKLAEETSNRIFSVKLDTDKEVIARLPFPIAGPMHFLTASEVATMEYARRKFGIPVPRVLGWCSHASSTPVGAEYIIMEKVPGTELHEIWRDMSGQPTIDIIDSLIQIEVKFVNTRFSQVGSLYFTEDVEDRLKARPLYVEDMPQDEFSHLFRIGPSVERIFWRGERANMNIDRGPWPDCESYARAIAECEISWLQRYARPHDKQSPMYRNDRENRPEEHITLLRRYLKLAPFMFPPRESCVPVLWHPDLHGSNLFIDQTPDSKFTGVIDWQGASIQPLYLQGGIPQPLQFQDGRFLSLDHDAPRAPPLPSNFDQLDPEDQKIARYERKAITRYKYYLSETDKHNHLHWFALLLERNLPGFHSLPLWSASRTWDEGMAMLREGLINLCNAWDQIGPPDVPCPVTFSDSERQQHISDLREWAQEHEMEALANEIGVSEDGWVAVDKYDEAKHRCQEVLEDLLAQQPSEEQRQWVRRRWPFQDGALSVQAEPCR